MRLVPMTRLEFDQSEAVLLNPDTIESVSVQHSNAERTGFNRQLFIRMRNGGAASQYAPVTAEGHTTESATDERLILNAFNAYLAGQSGRG